MIDPIRLYQVKDNNYSPILSQPKALAVGANQQIIAAVTGKKIRIMGWSNQCSTATVGAYQLLDGSGGSALTGTRSPPLYTAGLFDNLPIVDSGYAMETSTGVGLFCTINTADVSFLIFYITYVPLS